MLSFGVDLITFFDPGFWGVENEEQVIALGKGEPLSFWTRMLDTLQQSGMRGIELTFSPFSAADLIAAYGSSEAAGEELERRGLVIAGGFFADIAIEGGLGDPEREAKWLADGETLAKRIAQWGGTSMVIGLPMRASWDAEPPIFNDLDAARLAASLANRLGAVTLRHGVKLALHTEAHSMFCQPRDVDLLMLLTDPVYVGFCPDSAHILLSGGDPVEVARRHAERIVTAHWKDATGPMPVRIPIDKGVHHAHRPYFCALGAGSVDFGGWAQVMLARPDLEWAILEIDAVPDPLKEIRASLSFARTVPGLCAVKAAC
ncbi:TIM barrel protein [Novosphingobium profundi]|uniref:sugar phosphate isomerase/epimerase family protein n=1 Tax=Novosphingobium profundi TaxID=1774954 RepID=UPI001BD98C81|nr:sugar phosphate isomerase/epimerase [Novosphingobium profundi]MBT0671509.1 TIM barrel protein [Novosphingobium profundi]